MFEAWRYRILAFGLLSFFVINALSSGVGVQEAHGRPLPDVDEWRRVVGRMLGVR